MNTKELSIENISTITKKIRKKLLWMHCKANASHIGSAFSIVDLLTVLYFKILNIDPDNPTRPERDRFILSKGHAASAWYAVLAERGFFNVEMLEGFGVDGGALSEHPDRLSVPGVEASTGSLGHGLSIGVGIALAGKYDNKKYRTFVLMSDGECQEGSIWEAAISASRLRLDNLVGIIDANRLQAYERTDNIQTISSLKNKFENFGWAVLEIDGHNLYEIEKTFNNIPLMQNKPTMIIAHTVKGKGIKEMEDKLEWHYKSPKVDDLDKFIKEIGE
ncbi:transketolase [Caldanaerobius fijiensis DSM 17918]|uniref:Transketolase n=1 Tax=Caldanaerobius fijiensis DSM 17918 TaxID=1121256 RepID=A0A1M5DZA2_9THEO|nr:transketolase [Caldanaerobius fijiensis]SHF72358.1 transketolase [Caldanaerobius fijiensis DSM 17918]